MTIEDRVELYKKILNTTDIVKCIKTIICDGYYDADKIEKLELIRKLNTALTSLYSVTIPVITVWVRDDNYIDATQEIYLLEPTIEGFLHQFRHHLQNIEQRQDIKGLTVDGKLKNAKIPYTNTIYTKYGEDDAIAWSKMLMELVEQ